jgi:hypothetical protein
MSTLPDAMASNRSRLEVILNRRSRLAIGQERRDSGTSCIESTIRNVGRDESSVSHPYPSRPCVPKKADEAEVNVGSQRGTEASSQERPAQAELNLGTEERKRASLSPGSVGASASLSSWPASLGSPDASLAIQEGRLDAHLARLDCGVGTLGDEEARFSLAKGNLPNERVSVRLRHNIGVFAEARHDEAELYLGIEERRRAMSSLGHVCGEAKVGSHLRGPE